MLTYNALLKEKHSYNKKEITEYITTCQNTSDNQVATKNKLLLFKKMSKIIITNVDNFFFLTRNHEKKLFYEKDELVTECYFVFDKCVKEFDCNRNLDFFFYLNKALRRKFTRIIESEYKNHYHNTYSKDEFVELEMFDSLQVENVADFTFYYVSKSMNLTLQEKSVMISRLRKQSVEEFLKLNRSFNDKTYNEVLNSLKIKVKKFTDDNK